MDLMDQQEAQLQTAIVQKQQLLDEQEKQFAATLQEAERVRLETQANENHQNELDRINKKEVANINALKNNENATADIDNSGVSDALEVTNQMNVRSKADKDFNAKMADINSKNSLGRQKLAVDREKLQVDRENQTNDLQIAKENAKGRNKGGK